MELTPGEHNPIIKAWHVNKGHQGGPHEKFAKGNVSPCFHLHMIMDWQRQKSLANCKDEAPSLGSGYQGEHVRCLAGAMACMQQKGGQHLQTQVKSA
jgi:hypothetical protein